MRPSAVSGIRSETQKQRWKLLGGRVSSLLEAAAGEGEFSVYTIWRADRYHNRAHVPFPLPEVSLNEHSPPRPTF